MKTETYFKCPGFSLVDMPASVVLLTSGLSHLCWSVQQRCDNCANYVDRYFHRSMDMTFSGPPRLWNPSASALPAQPDATPLVGAELVLV